MKINSSFLKSIIFPVLLGLSIPLHAVTLKPFVSGSYKQIINANHSESFLIAFWSIDCPPCHDELAMLGKYTKLNPKTKIVLISTDDLSFSDQARKLLTKYELTQTENWIFADSNTEKLRYEIKRRWYGELPASMFYSANGSKKWIIGKIDSTDLKTLLN